MANLHIDGHSNIHGLVGSEHLGCNVNISVIMQDFRHESMDADTAVFLGF